MKSEIPAFLLSNDSRADFVRQPGRLRYPFVDRTLRKAGAVITAGYLQWETAAGNGMMQRTDARVKTLFLLFFVVLVGLTRPLSSQMFFSGYLLTLFALSGINFLPIILRTFIFAFIFGFLVAAPAMLNIFVDGEIVLNIATLSKSHQIWIYTIPQHIGITREGTFIAFGLFFKVFNSVTLSSLIIFTTPFTEIIRSLRIFRVPSALLMVITLTYKYIFVLSHSIGDMYRGMKSRLIRNLRSKESRKIIAGRIAFIFTKSWKRYEEVFNAMTARGYTGQLSVSGFRKFRIADLLGFLILAGIGLTLHFIEPLWKILSE
ncbi:MAG: cobalt ECF transporter T component CbiQ [Bacteroidetes bacterium]|nr:cobalt ECF transporter T component CbiQ [Bacteroidota bacterium]